MQRSDPEHAQSPPSDYQTLTLMNVLALAFFVAFLTIQVAVPIVKLGSARPARFGWHMWTARKRNPQFVLVMKDGTKRLVSLSTYLGLSRGELDFREAMAEHLCRVVPEVAAVQIDQRDSDSPKVYSCP